MAAIIPHIEQQEDERPDVEQAANACASGLSGLHAHGSTCPLPDEVIGRTHMELERFVWTRAAYHELLAERTVSLVWKVEKADLPGGLKPLPGRERRVKQAYLELDRPITKEEAPPWNPLASSSIRRVRLLSWTSKMGAPSFSLPAGAPSAGGSCPGATAGQSLVPERDFVAASRLLQRVAGIEPDLSKAICQRCVTGDARVLVKGRGLVRIADLVGQEFEVWSGIDWRKTHVIEQGIAKVVELRTNWGFSVRLTPDHKVMTTEGMVPVAELSSGRQLVYQPLDIPDPFGGFATHGDVHTVESVTELHVHEPVYDLINVGEERQFVANGITISNCYAQGGQYETGNVTVAQMITFAWTQHALEEGTFVDTMVEAIENAEFFLDGYVEKKKVGGEEVVIQHPPERLGRKFFRIHDSGDFFSQKYMAAWFEVARRLPDVTFWAPTRVWAVGMRLPGPVPSNMVLRPSGYHVGDAPPPRLPPDWEGQVAAWTTVIHKSAKGIPSPEREEMVAELEGRPPRLDAPVDDRFTWDCRAYAVASGGHTCRRAVAPDGRIGCRACWVFPDEVINYTEH